eukprot:gene26572-31956_t
MVERKTGRRMSVARQILLLQLALLALVIGVGAALAVVDERRDSDDAIRRQVSSIAQTLALSDSTAAALTSPDPTAILQPQTEKIRQATGVDFIVVMAPDRTRFTHTSPELIGQLFTGNIDRALAGVTFTETYAGSLGPSIRAVTPVYDSGGTLVGLVSAGVTREQISKQFAQSVPVILFVAGGGLLAALLSSLLVSRRIRRQTLGMAPDELRTMYEHHDAVLHSIGEGLVVIGRGRSRDARVDIVNDEARRLLDLPDGPVPLSSIPETMRVDDASPAKDQVHLTDKRVLVVNQHPVEWEGNRIGTVLTIRDHTELQNVLGELDSVRSFAESLRSQAHESANRLHTIITMVELGRNDDAVAFATNELRVSQQLIDRLMNAVHEPALAALLLGKMSEAAERGVDLTITEDTALGPVPSLNARELVTLVGNLVDNAIDASRASESPWVEVTVMEEDSMMVVAVADSGPGMTPEALEKAKGRGYSTKSGSRGLGLALVSQVVKRHGGTLTSEPAMGSMLVVLDDEPLIAQAHRSYVERVPEFVVHGVVHSGNAAVRAVTAANATDQPIDLVLLDIGLPDASGLDVASALGGLRPSPDIIAVTSARDLEVVRSAVARGIVLYLLKPFTFAAFRDKLERYLEYRAALPAGESAVSQHDIDRAMSALRTSDDRAAAPKGFASQTLGLVAASVRDSE